MTGRFDPAGAEVIVGAVKSQGGRAGGQATTLVRQKDGWTDDPERSATWKRAKVKARRIIRQNREVLDELAGHLSVEGSLKRFQIVSILRAGKVKSD